MTTTRVDWNQRLTRIHERGYWRVLIHPTVFDEHRIASLPECWRLIESAQVSLRGYLKYPMVDAEQRLDGDDWVQSGGEFVDGLELWRCFQSGQFVHHFSVSEDWQPDGARALGPPNGASPGSVRTLSIYNTLYTLTEILEFARKLAYRDVLEPAAVIQIELHGMKGRGLEGPGSLRMRRGLYRSQTDLICWKKTVLATELLVTAMDLALDAAVHVFERFNWNSPSRAMLQQGQRQLLTRGY
jgi:hypothetical protein